MAITKIHPIRRTLNKAVKYITNPKKTEEELFVSCFGCTKETIEKEFESTKKDAASNSPILAQHLIQSFAKGEVDPETAHAIGKELADRFTRGQHEYILSTHLDRGHIHNHIIFNHVNFIDHSCFHSDAKKMRELRSLNDEICENHGLSVIKNPQNTGSSYYEWAMNKLNRSYKKRLRDNIDMLIPLVHSYGELLIKMQELGYEIKTGKYDSFRMNGQERFTRSKTLGPDYTKEAIVERINNPVAAPVITPVKKPAYIRIWKYDQELGLIENAGNYLLFIQSNYTKQRMAIQEAKKIAATYNLLKEKGIDSISQLNEAVSEAKKSVRETRDSIRGLEEKIAGINETIKYAQRIDKYHDVYGKYLESGKSTTFYESHRSEIMLYESAISVIERKDRLGETVSLSQLKKELPDLEDRKLDMSLNLESMQSEYNDLMTAKRNIDIIVNGANEHKQDQSRDQVID